MKLYLKYFEIHLKSLMQYKKSFLMMTLGQFFVSLNLFFGITFLFARFSSLKGYTYEEVLICFSIVLMQFSSAEMFARGFDAFPSLINQGQFDRILLRPKSTIFQVLATKMDFSRIGRFIQALLVFSLALTISPIQWNLLKIITVIFMLIGGFVLFTSIFIVNASFCFFTIEGLEFMNIFTDGAREFGTYPLNIYGKRILQFLTYIIPYACTQYYPYLYLIDKVDHPLYCLMPLISFLFFIPCYLFWKFGVRHYTSTGS